jgi:hypothetical protein
MQIYYRDHPEVGGYIYLALRAPNDAWNGFYADHVYPLIDNLIRQFRLLGDIDPDKVFLMGYSHGGYGACFQLYFPTACGMLWSYGRRHFGGARNFNS